jgi:hypothetical protein
MSRILRKWEIQLEQADTTPKAKFWLWTKKRKTRSLSYHSTFQRNKSDLDIPEC